MILSCLSLLVLSCSKTIISVHIGHGFVYSWGEDPENYGNKGEPHPNA